MDQIRPMTLTALLSATAASVPDRVGLSAPGEPSLSYSQLCSHLARVGTALRAAGIGRGDRVATVLPNGDEAALAFLGIASAAVCAPLNPACSSVELERFFTDLRCPLLVTDQRLDSAASEVARRLDLQVIDVSELATADPDGAIPSDEAAPNDVALLLSTSGTTSKPKLVPLTHANLCASAGNVAGELRLTDDDRCLNVMPLFHIHGLVAGLLASLAAGAQVICAPGFHAVRMLEWLEEARPTWYTAVPTMHQALLSAVRRRGDVPVEHSLRLIRSSSAPLLPAVLAELEHVFRVPVIESYGMTEGAHQITSNPLPPAARKPGTVGPAAGVEVEIIGADGKRLPVGEPGEIVIRGPNVTSGYVDDPSANEVAFTRDGWFRTGDEGVLDEEGYLTITGRLKEMINRGGEKVAPREVDDALAEHSGVEQAVAFAIPHPTLGEEIGAAVALRPGVETTGDELRAFVATRLPLFKVPRRIVLLDELPKGPTGKVQRICLAELLEVDGYRSTEVSSPQTALEAALSEIWAELLDETSVETDQDFFMLGGDSLLAAELLSEVANRFGVEVPIESLLDEASTVAGMASLVGRADAKSGARSRRLFEIQPRGSRHPLFYVDPSLVVTRRLLPLLGPDQPILGLLMAPVDENPSAFAQLETVAEYHLRTLKEARPHGPYLLAGHSSAGLVAFELARRLRARGDTVDLVVMLDTISPTLRYLDVRLPLGVHLRRARRLGPWARAEYARSYVLRRSRLLARRLARRPPPGELKMNTVRACRYRPGDLDAPVVLLRTAASANEAGDSTLGWDEFASRLEVHEVPGSHASMHQEPHALALAEAVATALGAARDRL